MELFDSILVLFEIFVFVSLPAVSLVSSMTCRYGMCTLGSKKRFILEKMKDIMN